MQKDYYYILGLKTDCSLEEIKKAYRKLSLKFHPDKNDGDTFFADRFKEIQEAYEVLSNSLKRESYDQARNRPHTNTSGKNFMPVIEFFQTNQQAVEYESTLTFSWQTFNADHVELRPFGVVNSEDTITYRIKDFENEYLRFELIATNTHIGKSTSKYVRVQNLTYKRLKEKIITEYFEELRLEKQREEEREKRHKAEQEKIFVYEKNIREGILEVDCVNRDYPMIGDNVRINGKVPEDGNYNHSLFTSIKIKNGKLMTSIAL